ncbi:tryptophan--tRNA ligase [Candidatus Saccharibacteria bacterium]|jgi:tryptophanyl-tRNA synthetase|nr:tryptophan--tRNA ligase [Candidatus Saccharibacteria bacterium]
MNKEVILTGLRSNAEFHIGNYLGAILPMVQLQHGLKGEYQLNMFVPDLHSFTTPIEHGNLYTQTLENVKVYAAAGLDIEDSDTFVYRQSHIPAHSEMTWILDCFAYFGELSRMTEFKEKSDNQANVSVGLFNYPVLMAADILLYGAKWVPVGEDQRQHLELTRDLAMRMNNKFNKELFVVPNEWQKQLEFVGMDKGVRIRSLRNPEKKMSKSVEDPAGTIMLSDHPDEASKKIMEATTDSTGQINFDWDTQPGITNLLQILALSSGRSQDEVNKEWVGQNSYGELKSATAAEVKRLLGELQGRINEVDMGRLTAKLADDEAKMSEVANNTLHAVQTAVGLRG